MTPANKARRDRKQPRAARQESSSGRLVETLLVIGAVLLIPLFFAVRSGAIQLGVRSSAAPIEPAAGSLPSVAPPSSELAGVRPRQCAFPLAQLPTSEPAPEDYAFSKPMVVLTATNGDLYDISQWLPDNQRAIISEELRSIEPENTRPLQESISLFNPQTGERNVYAVRPLSNEASFWLPEVNAIVYSAINYTKLDRKAGITRYTRQLLASYGSPDTTQLLDDDLSQLPVVAQSNAMVYFSNKKIVKLDNTLKKLPAVPLDSARWDYAKTRRDSTPISFELASQPGTPLIFLFSRGYLGGGGYTFILNSETGEVCELDLGGWASKARWSSDGHILAIGSVTDSHPAELAWLDTVSGTLTTLTHSLQGFGGPLSVADLIWAPDDSHLLVLGSIASPRGSEEQALYLLDTKSQQLQPIQLFGSTLSTEDGNWAWSPDGSKVLIRCPTQSVDRLCLIPVQTKPQ